jgi:hypothetical protein
MEKTIVIGECEVELVGKKTDAYGVLKSYFKLVDPDMKRKLKPVSKYKELKLPFWKSATGDYLLAVKDKHVSGGDTLTRDAKYNALITFANFELVDKDIEGYYAKISKFVECSREDKPVMSDDSRD